MVRRFFKDSAIYGVANLAARGLSLFMVPYYVRVLSPADVGTLDILLAWGSLAGVATGLEIAIGMAREYAGQKDEEGRREVSSTALWFSVAVYAIFLAAVFLTAETLAQWLLGSAGNAQMVMAAGASVAGGGIFVIISQQLRYMMQPRLFAATSLLNAFAGLSATVIFVSWLGLGVPGVFLGTATGLAAGCGMAWWFTRHTFRWRFNWKRCAHLLRFSLPLIPSSIATVVSLNYGRIVLDALLSRDAVGVFGIAMRLGTIITLVMAGFNSAMAPLVFSRHEAKETPGDLARIFRIFSVAALLGTAAFILFTPEILRMLTTPKYADALPVIMILAPAALLSQMYIFAPGAWISKKTWCISAVNIGAAAVNVGLTWLLIPRLGLPGAAWAVLGAAVVSFSLSMVVSQHFYPVPHRWRQLGVALAGTAVLAACGVHFGGTVAWQGLFVRCAAAAAVAGWIHLRLGLNLRVWAVQ